MTKERHSTEKTITNLVVKGIARLGLVAALLVTGLLVAAPSVQAITYDFTQDYCTGGCGTAPFGSVTLTQNGSSVDVTAHLNDPNAWVKTGAGASQAFLFNAIDITLADITIDPFTPALSAASGPLHANGSGFWDFGINCPTCDNGGSGQFTGDILFHVANALISDLTVANATGNIFAADIFGGNANTGVVSVPGTTTTSGSTSSSTTSGDSTGSTSSSTTSGDSTGSTSSSTTSGDSTGSTSSSTTSGSSTGSTSSSTTSGDSTGSTSSSTTSGDSTGSTSSSTTSGDSTGSTSSSTSGDTGSSSTGTNTTGASSSNSTGESSGATTRDIPEPASLLLVGAGLVALSRVARGKRD